jgi:hypothetical protein
MEDISQLPLYASRNNWAKVLGCEYCTIKRAFNAGRLEGDIYGNRIYHSRKQILEWRAPSLLKEIEAEEKINIC